MGITCGYASGMNTNTTPTFKLDMAINFGKIHQFSFYTSFLTEQEREAFAATLPKSLKAKFYMTSGATVVNHFGLSISASLVSTKNNTNNETGINRFHKVVELFADQIVPAGYSNCVKSIEEAVALVNALEGK